MSTSEEVTRTKALEILKKWTKTHPITNRVISITGIIVNVVEELVKRDPQHYTSQQKLDLAFSLTDTIVDSLVEQKLISAELGEEVKNTSTDVKVFSDMVSDVVYLMNQTFKKFSCCRK